MTTKISRSRDDVPFCWSAFCGIEAMATLAGVRFDLVFRDLDAIAEAYKKGAPMARDLFGPAVELGGPIWAENSYAHVNCLGAELIFPEDSEVAHTPVYDSLEDGVEALKVEVDFRSAGMVPLYLDLWEKLKKAFPGRRIPPAGIKAEGPLTTAWCLRGHGFFTDIFDNPTLVKEYLRRVTASVVEFIKVVSRINGKPEFSETGIGLVDDVSAMIRPALWPEFVLPFLEQYYTGLTSGSRSAHIEDLTVDHLKYLDELGLDSYDPSVSEKLTPALIRDHCLVPFHWRLNETQYAGLTPVEVEEWVFDAAADGASGVHTGVGRNMCTPETAEKVRAFARAAKNVERLLAEGCPREKIREYGPR